MKNSRLTALFDDLNRTYFSGRLPRYRVRQRVARFEGEYGYCDSDRRVIFVVSGLDDELLRETLLHEMSHIGTPGHGKRFQTKLARLAGMGELWAEKQRLEYIEGVRIRRPLTALIRDEIEDLALDHPSLTWLKARRAIAQRLGLPVAKLLKAAPWSRNKWNSATEENRLAARP